MDPGEVAFYAPRLCRPPKDRIYNSIGQAVGTYPRSMVDFKAAAEAGLIPASFCFLETASLFHSRRKAKQPFLYFDRGYFARGKMAFKGLPAGEGHGYFRVHFGEFQLGALRDTRPGRFETLGIQLQDWRRGGDEIIVAMQSDHYKKYHGLRHWERQALLTLSRHTDRPIRLRWKGRGPTLAEDLKNAHALVTHGSIAAVEAAVMGVPVFVSPESAARFVGSTNLTKIETPVYPPRLQWARALANSQFHWLEITGGSFWQKLEAG